MRFAVEAVLLLKRFKLTAETASFGLRLGLLDSNLKSFEVRLGQLVGMSFMGSTLDTAKVVKQLLQGLEVGATRYTREEVQVLVAFEARVRAMSGDMRVKRSSLRSSTRRAGRRAG